MASHRQAPISTRPLRPTEFLIHSLRRGCILAALLSASFATGQSQDRPPPLAKAVQAIEKGQPAILSDLLDSGIDPNTKVDGDPLLHIAIRLDTSRLSNDPVNTDGKAEQKQLSLVTTLLDAGADVNLTNEASETALVVALGDWTIQSEIVQHLLDKKPDVNLASAAGLTAIHLAACYPKILERVIALGADVDSKTPGAHFTPLMLAAQRLRLKSMQILIEADATVDALDAGGFSTVHHTLGLHYSAGTYHPSVGESARVCLDFLQKAGADLKRKSLSGSTALHVIASHPCPDVVQWLLDQGLKAGAEEQDGTTALHIATEHGRHENFQLLVEAGISPDTLGPDGSALTVAARVFHERPMSEELYMGGAALADRAIPGLDMFETIGMRKLATTAKNFDAPDNEGRTPLIWAAATNFPTAVELLLDKGASIDAVSNDGRTALMWAACANADQTIRVLLDRGADASLTDKTGRSAVVWAQELANHKAAKLLAVSEPATGGVPPLISAIITGEDAAALDLIEVASFSPDVEYFGATPLHHAAEYGRTKIARALIKDGAKIDGFDTSYNTPLRWALFNDHDSLIDLLLENGADPMRVPQLPPNQYHWMLPNNSLEYAIREKDGATVRKLISRCQRKLRSIEACELLDAAIANEREVIFANLLASEHIEMPSGATLPDHSGTDHPFQFAAKMGNIKLMKEIANMLGVDTVVGSKLASRSLHSAIRSKQVEAAELLLNDFGIDLAAVSTPPVPVDPFAMQPAVPLHLAIEGQYLPMMQLLIEHGAKAGAHELSLALFESDDTRLIAALLNIVENVDEYHGNATALMKAAEYGRLEGAKLLIKHGADSTLLARDELTLLDYAKSGGNARLIQIVEKLTSGSPPQTTPKAK